MFKIQDVTPIFKVIHDKFSLIEVTLVGCKIYGKYIQEESESINSPVPACLSYFIKSTLKSPNKHFSFLLKFFVIVCLDSYR